jgi:hypothetical protein
LRALPPYEGSNPSLSAIFRVRSGHFSLTFENPATSRFIRVRRVQICIPVEPGVDLSRRIKTISRNARTLVAEMGGSPARDHCRGCVMTRKHDHKIQITQTVDEQQRIGAKVEDLIEGAESILKHEQYYRSDNNEKIDQYNCLR